MGCNVGPARSAHVNLAGAATSAFYGAACLTLSKRLSAKQFETIRRYRKTFGTRLAF